MAITWRAVVLTALGVVPVLLVPVTLVILAWALVVVLACSVDVALAASPRLLAVQRNVPPSVRLTEQTRSTLTVTNRSGAPTAERCAGPRAGAGTPRARRPPSTPARPAAPRRGSPGSPAPAAPERRPVRSGRPPARLSLIHISEPTRLGMI